MQERRRYLIPWGALGAIEAFIFGTPFAIFGMSELLDANDFLIAKTCFVIGCLLLGIQAILLVARRSGLMSYLLVFVSCGAIGVAGLALVNYVNHKRDAKIAKEALTTQSSNTASQSPCKLTVDSQIVARLFGETMKAPPPNVGIEARFKYKELFYEWSVTIAPEQEMSEVSLIIDHLQSDDRISTIPDAASASDLKPRWVSGFEEKRPPDHYAKTFKFTSLAKERTARILIRRPINQLAVNHSPLVEPNIIRLADVVAKDCPVEAPKIDPGNEAKRLSVHLTALAAWNGGRGDNKPMPIKADPGIFPKAGYILPSVEARCLNESCDQLSMGQLEVKWGGKK